jgi:hypothetical protein
MAERVLNDLKFGLQRVRGPTERQRGQVIVTSQIAASISALC